METLLTLHSIVRWAIVGVAILAVVAAHLPARWKSAPDKVRHRNTLFAFVTSLVLIFIGVAVLPGGWSR